MRETRRLPGALRRDRLALLIGRTIRYAAVGAIGAPQWECAYVVAVDEDAGTLVVQGFNEIGQQNWRSYRVCVFDSDGTQIYLVQSIERKHDSPQIRLCRGLDALRQKIAEAHEDGSPCAREREATYTRLYNDFVRDGRALALPDRKPRGAA